MRILLIAPPWFSVPPDRYGGIEWVVAQLADGLAAGGHDVTLVASGGSDTKAALRSVFDEPPSEQLGSAWLDLVHVLGAYDGVEGYDIVHDHSGIVGPALGASLNARGLGPPVVHTLHGPWTQEASLLYEAMPPALHLVAISEDQRRRAPDDLNFAGVVHNGIPVDLFPYRAERRVGHGPLAFVGRANPEKGPDLAIEVARRLGRPLHMAIKVNEPDEHAYWDEVLRPLLDGVDVEVHPNADHATKAAVMAEADALLVPIRWAEPFGLVMAEALACGTPVVAFGLGAAPEVVEDGHTGFIVPPGDLDAFCEAVEAVDRIDPAACRLRAAEHFSSERMVAGYLAIFHRLLERGQSMTSGPAGSGSMSRIGAPTISIRTPAGAEWTKTPDSPTTVIESSPVPTVIPPT